MLVVTLGLVGCRTSEGAPPAATVPTAPSTTSTTAPIDVSVIPPTIDVPYLNAVLATLDEVDAEAGRIIVTEKRFTPEAADLLNAIYSDEPFRIQGPVSTCASWPPSGSRFAVVGRRDPGRRCREASPPPAQIISDRGRFRCRRPFGTVQPLIGPALPTYWRRWWRCRPAPRPTHRRAPTAGRPVESQPAGPVEGQEVEVVAPEREVVADAGGASPPYDPGAPAAGRGASLRRALPVVGLVVAAWAVLPPYTGPEIGTSTRVEVADHVVPAVLMIALSVAALATARRPAPGLFALVAGLGVLLAGLWMTATHVPLVAQATRDEVAAGAAAYHTAPGLAVLALGVVWVAAHWGDASG